LRVQPAEREGVEVVRIADHQHRRAWPPRSSSYPAWLRIDERLTKLERYACIGVPGSLVGEGAAMSNPPRNFPPASRASARDVPGRFRSRLSVARTKRPSDVKLIGRAHPLARVSRAVAAVERMALAVVALLIALVGVGDAALAQAVPMSAVGVLLVLVAVRAVLTDERRRLALDLIAEGQERLPVRAMVRERDRLADMRSRARLAKSYECVFEEGLGLRRPVPGRLPMVRPKVAAAVLAELSAVAALLRSDRPGLRGVALAERLLIDGGSPLYGEDASELRDELERARSLLCS
jgi:hypothetical protein